MAFSSITAFALCAVLAIALSSFFSSEERRIASQDRLDYTSTGWFRECAQWDAQNQRFLVSFMEGGLGQVSFPQAPSGQDRHRSDHDTHTCCQGQCQCLGQRYCHGRSHGDGKGQGDCDSLCHGDGKGHSQGDDKSQDHGQAQGDGLLHGGHECEHICKCRDQGQGQCDCDDLLHVDGEGQGLGVGQGRGQEQVLVGSLGFSTLGFKVDAERGRVVAIIGDSWRHRFSGMVSYDLTTWEVKWFIKLAGPETSSLADDVAIDDDGNIYATDAVRNLIWKVSSDGSQVSILTDNTTLQTNPKSYVLGSVGLNGIAYHRDGFLLVAHMGGDALFRVSLDGKEVTKVIVRGGVLFGDGITLVSPDQLAVASLWSGVKLVESKDQWLSANVTQVYSSPRHRLATSVTVKDGDVYANYLNGFGIPYTSTISRVPFKPRSVE